MEMFQIAKRKKVCAKTLHFGYLFIRFLPDNRQKHYFNCKIFGRRLNFS